MNQPDIEARQDMVRRERLPVPVSAIQGYGLAVLSVCTALSVSLLLNYYNFRGLADLLFVLAIAITSWYADPGPALLALVSSFLIDDYFFIEPLYSFRMTSEDIPHFVIFVLFASLVSRFAAVRRRVERRIFGDTYNGKPVGMRLLPNVDLRREYLARRAIRIGEDQKRGASLC